MSCENEGYDAADSVPYVQVIVVIGQWSIVQSKSI
jgi:hypothetical protein